MSDSARLGATAAGASSSDAAPLTVLVYSQRAVLRASIRSAVGRRPAQDLPRVDWVECVSYEQVKSELDGGDVDLAIFDGEAQPTGGMGLARQFKNELRECPPIVVVVGRAQDRWLASWALADAVLVMPIDPVAAAAAVAETLRKSASTIPVIR